MLANYSELQTEIADTLHRNDLTSKIPTFISLFEKRANRNLRTLLQEVTTDLTLSSGQNSVALPSNFIELIALSYADTDDFNDSIIPMVGIEFDRIKRTDSGSPTYCNIHGSTIYFDCKASQDFTFTLRYIQGWDLATNLTNWLLDNYPDCYLYGALAASAVFIGEDDRLGLWRSLASDAIQEANNIANRTRSKAPLLTDPGLTAPGKYNINTGEYR